MVLFTGVWRGALVPWWAGDSTRSTAARKGVLKCGPSRGRKGRPERGMGNAGAVLEGFLSHLSHERNLSPHSRRAYEGDVRDLFVYLGITEPDATAFDPA